MNRIAIATHTALVGGKEYDGIGNSVKETLSGLTDEFVFVRHSMDGLLSSEVQLYKNKDKLVVESSELKVVRAFGPLRYISEVRETVKYFTNNPVDVYVGVDPLNALAGVILKQKGVIKKAIFYTPDYSPKRFSSKILNKIYHKIDEYCVKNSDEVWSVSLKIVEIRRKMGLSENVNILIPNVPPTKYDVFKKNDHNKYSIITYGIIDNQMDFEGLIKAVSLLKKDIPEIKLIIAGNGPEEANLKKLTKSLGITKNVHFMGKLKFSDTLELASKSGVGAALYNGRWGFNEFGDSTKVREYTNFGLPVLSTDKHATVLDIEKFNAGVIVDVDTNSYVAGLQEIFNNYDKYSANSRKMGEAYAGVHSKLFKKLLRQK